MSRRRLVGHTAVGVAFFVHIGGFVFGFVVAAVLLGSGPVSVARNRVTSLRAPA